MKIAISTDRGSVSPHFGRCAIFTLVEVEADRMLKTEEIENPGHHPGFLPQFLSEKGVGCIICGGMGHRAQSLFHEKGIDTMVGVVGRVEYVINKFAGGNLVQGESMCDRGPGECHRKNGERRER